MATLNVTTATTIDANIPEYWATKVIRDAVQKAFWSRFEGPEGSSGKPIIRKDDPLKKAGDAVHFTTLANLYGDGVTGANTLAGSEQVFDIDSFSLSVDWVRNAVAYNARAEGRALMDLAKWAGTLLSDWFARKTDFDLFTQITSTDSPTTLYANAATSEATLDYSLGTTFGVNEIERIVLELESMGAEPVSMIRDNGEEFYSYGIVISEFDAYHLRNDSLWWKMNAEAGVRGQKNPLFKGAIGEIFGATIYVLRGVRGLQGTPLRPETKIYSTHNNSTTTILVGSGSDDGNNYTKNFADTGEISVVNSSGATEFMTYTSKTAYSFTVTGRGETYGSTTSSASAYTGNERVTQGHYLSKQVGFGSNIAIRSFAKAMHRIEQKEDYGFEIGIGVAAIYGQKALLDSNDAVKNCVLMKSCSKPPEAS